MSKEYKEATGVVIRLEWLEDWKNELTLEEIGEAVYALANYLKTGEEYNGNNRVLRVMLKNCYKCIDYDLNQYDHKAKRPNQEERKKMTEFFEKKLKMGSKYSFAQMGQDMGTSKSTAQRDYTKWLSERENAPIIRTTRASDAEAELQIQIQTGTSHGPAFVPKSSQNSQMGKIIPNETNSSQIEEMGRAALTPSELNKYVEMYKYLDELSYGNPDPELEEIIDFLETGCYFNNPAEKIETMTKEELKRLEESYDKYR